MRTILVDAALTFTIEINGKFEIFSELLELLESFPNRKIIVTNANDEEMKKFGLVNAPYEVFSLKHNPNKTNPKYFELLFQHFNLKSEDVIYFEHTPKAVESAESLGIKSYFYDSDKKDLIALKKFLSESV